MPSCTLDLVHHAFISRQRLRWSDQWFALPRLLASHALNVVHRELKPHCDNIAPKGSQPRLSAKVRRPHSPPFEQMVFDSMESHARRLGIEIIPTLLPRVLARGETHRDKVALKDVATKCSNFLWFINDAECHDAVLGRGAESFA